MQTTEKNPKAAEGKTTKRAAETDSVTGVMASDSRAVYSGSLFSEGISERRNKGCHTQRSSKTYKNRKQMPTESARAPVQKAGSPAALE